MEYHVYWLLKSSCFELSRDGNTLSIELKSWWKDDICWLLESSCFELFKGWGIRSFFEPKSWWKDDVYWLLESFCFERFGDRKYGLFLSQKVDGKMTFTDYTTFYQSKMTLRFFLLVTCTNSTLLLDVMLSLFYAPFFIFFCCTSLTKIITPYWYWQQMTSYKFFHSHHKMDVYCQVMQKKNLYD